MINTKVNADRQFAADKARKYFDGQISKQELFDSFPDYSRDIKLSLLHKALKKEPRIGWLFGVTKEEHNNYVLSTYQLINSLENTKLQVDVMLRLFEELWFASDNCKLPIQNMGIRLMEVAKSTNNTVDDVREYLSELVRQGHIEISSKEPLIWQLTDKGKTIKTESDVQHILNNVA